MTFNCRKNVLTYRDMRLRGWQWLRGRVSFTLACSISAFADAGSAITKVCGTTVPTANVLRPIVTGCTLCRTNLSTHEQTNR